MQKLNVQDFFRAQISFSEEQIKTVDFGKPAKESCSVFATAYNEDTHMTRIYCCRPLPDDEENMFEK